MAVKASGAIALWHTIEGLQALAFAIWACLVSAGLGAVPAELTHMLCTYVISSLLYGCELWGLQTIGSVHTHNTLYRTDFMLPILAVLHSHSGFSYDSHLI